MTSALRTKPERIAHELRCSILDGTCPEGTFIGRETELTRRFDVSRPSMREALRILEADGLIEVVRGVRGGVVARAPSTAVLARRLQSVLAFRGVTSLDVVEALAAIELEAIRTLASSSDRRLAVDVLREEVDVVAGAVDRYDLFCSANGAFHRRLVAAAGNETMVVVADLLVALAASTPPPSGDGDSLGRGARLRIVHGQRVLLDLVGCGDAEAAMTHWKRCSKRERSVLATDHTQLREEVRT